VSSEVHCLAGDSTNLYAGTEGGGVFLSTNEGESWVRMGLGTRSVYSLALKGSNLFAGTELGTFYSTDGGASWSALSEGQMKPYVNALAYTGITVLAGTAEGTFRSTDNGATWGPVGAPLTSMFVQVFAFSGEVFYAGVYGGVYRSTDGGEDWTPFISELPYTGILSLAVSGTDLFVGTSDGQVYHSTLNGSAWEVTTVSTSRVQALAVSGRNVLAGTASPAQDSGSVFLSTDVGASWSEVNSGMPESAIQCLSARGGNIFAGTWARGVWRRTLSEITSVASTADRLPVSFALRQNYPNPFNPSTTIRFALPHRSHVTLTVYNTLGQQVAQLVNSDIAAGYHEVQFNASNLASGVYFYRMQAGSYVETKSLCLIK
jgi:photosystem II stability/assembly factor-like uncharacterized protein